MTIPRQDIETLLASKPRSLDELTGQITTVMLAELKSAIELGRWGDGNRLSAVQLENCLQLVILYEERHLPEEQRTGSSIPRSCQSKAAAEQQQPQGAVSLTIAGGE